MTQRIPVIPYLHQDEPTVWEGRVADVIDTRVGKLAKKESDESLSPGFYVKVRIFGIHTDDVVKLRNEQLPWIEVSGTVLGSGRSGSGSTPNIQPGDHVYGLYINGRPIIIGVQLCDPQENIPTFQGTDGYKSFSTYRLNELGPIARYSVPAKYALPKEKTWNPFPYSLSDEAKGTPTNFPKLACPSPNQKVNAAGMASKISGAIQKIEGYQKTVRKYEATALQYINDKEQKAQEWIQKASEWLTGKIDWLIVEIQKRVVGAINGASAAVSKQIPINGRWTARETQSAIVEAIICFFKKMVKAIAGIMEKIMRELVNRYVTVPLCAIENFLKTLLANIVGMLTSFLSSLAGVLKTVVSSVAGFINQVLGLVANILKLFECEMNEKESDVKEWHILDGANMGGSKFTLDINQIINDAKGLANNFTNIVDPNTFNINANLMNFSNIFASLTCNTSPIPCGPPTIQFFGGGGRGTTGNVIVGALGEILGVDIIAPGFNYSGQPAVTFIDACGKGYNAGGYAVMGKVPTVVLSAIGPTSNGSSYRLVWKSKNAVRAVTNFGSTDLNGNSTVTPLTATTYTITVFDSNGFQAQDSVTITPGVSIPDETFIDEQSGTGDGGAGTGGAGTGGTGGAGGTGTGGTGGAGTGGTGGAGTGGAGTGGAGGAGTGGAGTGGTGGGGAGTGTGGTGGAGTGGFGGDDILNSLVIDDPIDIGVVAVVIDEPGFGYIPQGDGSYGGDGRTWSDPDETVVRIYNPIQGDGFGGTIGIDPGSGTGTGGGVINETLVVAGGTGGIPVTADGVPVFVGGNGTQSVLPIPQLVPVFGPGNRPDLYAYDLPYPPGSSINLKPGDIIQTPPNSSTTTVVDNFGNDIATVLPGVPTLIDPNTNGGTTTAPFPSSDLSVSLTDGSLPSSNDGKYPVILKICSVTVQNPGVNYSENDQIEVTPSNGAVLKPIFGPFGTISRVEVVESGMGFTEYPVIKIKSETGYNAVLIPYLCVNNIGDLPEEERNALAQEGKILQVVDCVGKV